MRACVRACVRVCVRGGLLVGKGGGGGWMDIYTHVPIHARLCASAREHTHVSIHFHDLTCCNNPTHSRPNTHTRCTSFSTSSGSTASSSQATVRSSRARVHAHPSNAPRPPLNPPNPQTNEYRCQACWWASSPAVSWWRTYGTSTRSRARRPGGCVFRFCATAGFA